MLMLLRMNVMEVDGHDITEEGSEAWEADMERYDARINGVETRITARLRTAKNANEMFRIFSRFNNMFVRPTSEGPSGTTRLSLSREARMTSRCSTCSPRLARCPT